MTIVSQSERQIRDAAIVRARELWPSARIIHELNVEHGQVRADVAAVTDDTLILFEIKSERDKLHRLSNQLRQFGPVCHHLIVAAHEKWCCGSAVPNQDVDPIIRFAGHGWLWRYPEETCSVTGRQWSAPYRATIPWPHRMLRLLWTEELLRIAAVQGLAKVGRRSGFELCETLARSMPGADIERAVCRALRSRQFAEADAAIKAAA